MYNKFKFQIFVLTFVNLVKSQSTFENYNLGQEISKINKNITFSNSNCLAIKDCYNCTVYNCLWEGGQCNSAENQILTPSLFFERGSKCTKNQERCQFNNMTDGQTKMIFTQENDLPANFFCMFNFNQPDDYKNFFLSMQKSGLNEFEDEFEISDTGSELEKID